MPEEVTTTPAAPATAEIPAEPAVESPPAAQPVQDSDPFDNAEVQQFDRTYVEKLRKEAASHRTAKQRYEEAFKGWDAEADVPVWLETIQLASQPGMAPQAAERLRQIADLIHKGATPEEAVEQVEAQEEQPKFLTQEELDAKLAEREQLKEVETQVRAIKSKATELGYAEGSMEYQNLLWTAQNETSLDLDAAHAKLEERKQAIIDSYLESKRKQAEGDPGTPTGGAHIDGSVKHDGSFETARARTEARIRASMKAAAAD